MEAAENEPDLSVLRAKQEEIYRDHFNLDVRNCAHIYDSTKTRGIYMRNVRKFY